MLADFYIPRLSNDVKIGVQKSPLWAQIFYRTLTDPNNFQMQNDRLVIRKHREIKTTNK